MPASIHINSPVEAIDRLRFKPFPTRPTGVQKVYRSDPDVFALLKGGAIATTHRNALKPISFEVGRLSEYRTRHLLGAALALGLLTKDQHEEHIKACAPIWKKSDERRDAAWTLQHAAGQLGLKLTAEQKRLVKKAAVS